MIDGYVKSQMFWKYKISNSKFEIQMKRLYVLLLVFISVDAKATFKVEKDASFDITGSDGFKLESGHYMFRKNGKTFSTVDSTLNVSLIAKGHGLDLMGPFDETIFNMTAKSDALVVRASIRIYQEAQFAIFKQSFSGAFRGMSLHDTHKVTSSFPSLSVPKKSQSVYINPCDEMAGWTKLKMGKWNAANMTDMCAGDAVGRPDETSVQSGPFFVFDRTKANHTGQVFTISAFSQFTVHYVEVNHDNNEIWFGLPGMTDSLPSGGFELETIISYSDDGFYRGIQKWGAELTRRYGKSKSSRETDKTVNFLSYWTDNGAFYYYHTEPDATYESTMVDVYRERTVPFRSWNFDSWWYRRCPNKGVKSWTALDSVFPSGMDALYQKTSMPVIAHNRWWCNETDYATRNGGDYEFVFDDENGAAVPIETRFWDDLFRNSTKWGLEVYLQDWLDVETDRISAFEHDVELERNWLLQMGQGAAVNGVNILYCMSYTRHMLQSVEIENVVSFRASDDYQPGNDQWAIGLTSAWIYAVGLAPFKDSFWTSADQPGNSKYVNKTEPNVLLQSAVATLSTGIVGIGDKIGMTDLSVISRSMRVDGLILKPSRPLVVPDYMVWEVAQVKSKKIEYETWSEVAGHRFGIILLYDPSGLTEATHYLENYQFNRQETDYTAKVAGFNRYKLETRQRWSQNSPLIRRSLTNDTLLMIYTSPMWKIGTSEVAFVGEVDKWTPVSPQRFTNIGIDFNKLFIDITGVPDEVINMQFIVQSGDDEIKIDWSCTIPQSGRATVVMGFEIKPTLTCKTL